MDAGVLPAAGASGADMVFAETGRAVAREMQGGGDGHDVQKRLVALSGRTVRFWSRVDKDGPGGCWEWHGQITIQGYGLTGGKILGTFMAHRVAWLLCRGPIPPTTSSPCSCQKTRARATTG